MKIAMCAPREARIARRLVENVQTARQSAACLVRGPARRHAWRRDASHDASRAATRSGGASIRARRASKRSGRFATRTERGASHATPAMRRRHASAPMHGAPLARALDGVTKRRSSGPPVARVPIAVHVVMRGMPMRGRLHRLHDTSADARDERCEHRQRNQSRKPDRHIRTARFHVRSPSIQLTAFVAPALRAAGRAANSTGDRPGSTRRISRRSRQRRSARPEPASRQVSSSCPGATRASTAIDHAIRRPYRRGARPSVALHAQRLRRIGSAGLPGEHASPAAASGPALRPAQAGHRPCPGTGNRAPARAPTSNDKGGARTPSPAAPIVAGYRGDAARGPHCRPPGGPMREPAAHGRHSPFAVSAAALSSTLASSSRRFARSPWPPRRS